MSSEKQKPPEEVLTPEEALERALAVDSAQDALTKRAGRISKDVHAMALVAVAVRDQHARRLDRLSGELQVANTRVAQLEGENRALRDKLLAFERLHAEKS